MATQARCATQTDGVEPGEMAHVTPPLAYSRTAHPIADRGTDGDRRADAGDVTSPNGKRRVGDAQKFGARSPLQNGASATPDRAGNQSHKCDRFKTAPRVEQGYSGPRNADLYARAG